MPYRRGAGAGQSGPPCQGGESAGPGRNEAQNSRGGTGPHPSGRGDEAREALPFTEMVMTCTLRTILLSALSLAASGCESRGEHTSSGRGDSAGAGTVIRISLAEWRVDLSPDTVPPGPVSLLVTNQGTDRHELEVEREDAELDFGEIPAGAQQRFAADLKPGVYDVYCPLADPTASHKSRGMIARLVVR